MLSDRRQLEGEVDVDWSDKRTVPLSDLAVAHSCRFFIENPPKKQ